MRTVPIVFVRDGHVETDPVNPDHFCERLTDSEAAGLAFARKAKADARRGVKPSAAHSDMLAEVAGVYF